MGKTFKRLVIVTGSLLLLAGAPIVQANPLGEYMRSTGHTSIATVLDTVQDGLSDLSFTITAQAAELTQSARWIGSGDRWQVSDNAGGYLKNTWFQDDITGHWYLLGAEDGSVMYAGLVTDQSTGKTYLMNTNHDGTYGRMISTNGVYNINGKNVSLTFNQNHDGTFGAITSGLSEARSSGVTEKSLASIPTADNTSQTKTSNGNGNQTSQKDISQMTNEELAKWFQDQSGTGLSGVGSGTGAKGQLYN